MQTELLEDARADSWAFTSELAEATGLGWYFQIELAGTYLVSDDVDQRDFSYQGYNKELLNILNSLNVYKNIPISFLVWLSWTLCEV